MADITSFDGISGSARTAPQLLALIEKIDLAIYNILNTDKNAGVTYRVGDRILDRNGYLNWLLEARKTYARQLASLPAWETTVYDDPDL
jgi:hypothetical protein